MITRDNLKFCFDNLNEKEVNEVMNSNKDFVLFELHTFNVGGYATIKAKNYKDSTANQAANNGQLFIDKDDFLRLFIESNSDNKYIKSWL